MTRQNVARLWPAVAGAGVATGLADGHMRASAGGTSDARVGGRTGDAQSAAPPAADDKLQSEFVLDLVLDRGLANNVGSLRGNRVVVPVLGGTFEGFKHVVAVGVYRPVPEEVAYRIIRILEEHRES